MATHQPHRFTAACFESFLVFPLHHPEPNMVAPHVPMVVAVLLVEGDVGCGDAGQAFVHFVVAEIHHVARTV